MKIPKDLCSFDLLSWVSRTTEIESNNTELRDALKHLCSPNIWYFSKQDFTNQERDIYNELDLCNSDNIEIAARANDVLRKIDKDKRHKSQLASDLYLQVFDMTNKDGYLIRSIEVRSIKEICDKEYFCHISERLPLLSPNAILLCLKAFHGSYKNQLQELSALLENIYNKYININSFRDARLVVDSLDYVEALNSDEANYRRALLYEQEADYSEANKNDNTFLMQTHILYKSAYQMINRVKKRHPEDADRIKQKLIKANRDFADFLYKYGERTDFVVNENVQKIINQECEHKVITNIYEAVGWLLMIQFPSLDQIDKCMHETRKQGMFSSMLNTSQNDENGNTIGIASADDNLRVNVHKYFRLTLRFQVYRYMQTIIQQKIDTSEDKVLECLFAFRPRYVSEDVVHLMAKGFSLSFDGEMIAAAHMLMPALEALLRQKAEALHGSQKKYENERNDDATLDGILRMLEKDFDNYEEWYELKSFLTMGIDVNYRNRLMHGLMHMPIIYNQGIYLFWLCLKMYFKDSMINE